MKLLKDFFISIFILTSLFAYTDNDIDGVDDSVDQCLNTAFDELVDETGCSIKQKNHTTLLFKVGSDVSFNTTSESKTSLNFFANYRFNNWDVSLSNSNYTTYDQSSGGNSEAGDFYVSGGYQYKKQNFTTKFSLGTKLATADEGTGTGENDYFASLNLHYTPTTKQDFFLYYAYTLSGDSATIDYENFNAISLGTGYAFSNKFYSGISYDYSGANSSDGEAYKAISWFNSYSFSRRLFSSISYTHALDSFSYDHTLSLKLGVYLE